MARAMPVAPKPCLRKRKLKATTISPHRKLKPKPVHIFALLDIESPMTPEIAVKTVDRAKIIKGQGSE